MSLDVALTQKRSALNEKLLANARKSITDIAEITGQEATEVAERLSRLLEDRGWLSERQEERLMLIELGDMIEQSKQRLLRASDEDYAGIAKITLGAMAQMADRWDKRKKLVEEDIGKITAANARTFSEAYDIAIDEVVTFVSSLYPEVKIEGQQLYDLKRMALLKAARVLDKNTAE